jgi:hypothetical protein
MRPSRLRGLSVHSLIRSPLIHRPLIRRTAVRRLLVAAAAAALAALSITGPAQAAASAPASSVPKPFGCNAVAPTGVMHCMGYIAKRAGHTSAMTAGPATTGSPTSVGYVPSQLRSAYKLTAVGSATETVAIVDAFDDPNAASDLATYRSAYGLSACTVGNGCFKKVNEHGATSPLPSTDYGWAEEESLDLDMVSAICPGCHILLVEASSATITDLAAAENAAAAAPNVVSVSNSWGGAESSSQTSADGAFNHPGVAITVSAGDSGYGTSWPATSPYVTSVGGTSLKTASNARGWTESVWSTSLTEGTGAGCSSVEAKPSWQAALSLPSGCNKRIDNDVAAVADPATGVAVYDTYNSCGTGSFCDFLLSLGIATGADGWVQVGGTSASSPIIASVYALAGNTSTVNYGSYPYSHTASLFDVTSGSLGSCSPSYLCTAGSGYDGPTGLGTPNGTGAF